VILRWPIPCPYSVPFQMSANFFFCGVASVGVDPQFFISPVLVRLMAGGSSREDDFDCGRLPDALRPSFFLRALDSSAFLLRVRDLYIVAITPCSSPRRGGAGTGFLVAGPSLPLLAHCLRNQPRQHPPFRYRHTSLRGARRKFLSVPR